MLRLDLCCDWIPVVATGYYYSWLLRLLKNNDIRTATENDQQQLRNLFIVIHLLSGENISCLNTQHDTWNSN
ncbi:hypothetical protein F511_37263 [Dorcoceras hygrometricum]|uniref:Uncharacterized protein n=1 Tax=Dorcoceras hygrometricum TaxID=472368 RepID=A0A2Z7BY09_9LAMI|nr:hypothetical protein F511_37263 [Dorcoceras hygrometricum]